MTKKDGDRLREMQQELAAIATAYEPGSETARGALRAGLAIKYTLEGANFRVLRVVKAAATGEETLLPPAA